MRKRIGPAVARDIALPIRAAKSVTIGTAVEHDIALPIRAVVGSAAAYLAVQSTVVHVPAPEPALHPQHAHDDLVAAGADVGLVLVTVFVGGTMLLQRLIRVRLGSG